MRVLLRCDASAAGGVGHVGRIVPVAEAASAAGWDVLLSGDVELPLARGLLERADADVRLLPAVSEPAELAALAAAHAIDVVHVDHYGIAPGLRDALAAEGVLLSGMEDGAYGRRPADLVVEPTPAAFATPRPIDGSRRIVGGADWVPLRAMIAALAAEPPERDGGILVMLGGTDAYGLSRWCVERLREAGATGSITVLGEIDALGLADVEVLAPTPDVAPLLARSRLVVCAAGTSLWELAALGTPSAVVAVTGNQDQNYDAALRLGIATGLGRRHGGLDDAVATALLRTALESPRVAANRPIDGLGASRIVSAWEELLRAPGGPQLRDAVAGDASLLYAWRDDPEVRAVSRAADPLDWDAHRGWLDRVVADPERILLMLEDGSVPAGMIRFDGAGHEVEVSIVLAPEARGKGLAGPFLVAAINELVRRRGAIALRAGIRAGNAASERLFAGAGFAPRPDRAEHDGFVTWLRPPGH